MAPIRAQGPSVYQQLQSSLILRMCIKHSHNSLCPTTHSAIYGLGGWSQSIPLKSSMASSCSTSLGELGSHSISESVISKIYLRSVLSYSSTISFPDRKYETTPCMERGILKPSPAPSTSGTTMAWWSSVGWSIQRFSSLLTLKSFALIWFGHSRFKFKLGTMMA